MFWPLFLVCGMTTPTCGVQLWLDGATFEFSSRSTLWCNLFVPLITCGYFPELGYSVLRLSNLRLPCKNYKDHEHKQPWRNPHFRQILSLCSTLLQILSRNFYTFVITRVTEKERFLWHLFSYKAREYFTKRSLGNHPMISAQGSVNWLLVLVFHLRRKTYI